MYFNSDEHSDEWSIIYNKLKIINETKNVHNIAHKSESIM
jgi:hypothetical protein